MEITKLGLISTEELLEEIQSRYDHCIFVGVAYMGSNRGNLTLDKKGLYFAQIGLLDYAYNRIQKKEPLNSEE